MADEIECRECDEAFGSEEGDPEPYLEEAESSRELLERLRELEAENSALALANESQREAYERCLDEVANHVVQALLNQKDLREECIKLKMRVFDLERQNRTLTELFHQKLHSHSVQQLLSIPMPEHNTESKHKGPDQASMTPLDGQAKNMGDFPAQGTADMHAAATSMEALSPFFKKKAHILEVLRRLEETDPLKYNPCSGLPSCHEFSPTLFPADVVLTPGSLPVQRKAPQPHCRQSCSDSDLQEYMNGEGVLPEDHSLEYRSCQSCLRPTQQSLDSLLKCNHGLGWHESLDTEPHTAVDRTSEVCLHSTLIDSHSIDNNGKRPQSGSTEPYLISETLVQEKSKSSNYHEESCSEYPPSFAIPLQNKTMWVEESQPPATSLIDSSGEHDKTEEETEEDNGSDDVRKDMYTTTSPDVTDCTQRAYCEREVVEKICNRLCFSSNESSEKIMFEPCTPAPVNEKNVTTQQVSLEKNRHVINPSSPLSVGEAKPSPISSPSRLLKFLKIPSIGERAQTANPLRLSPQLTRSSKIPCRNNNYEVYHSPVMGRKATTTERNRQSAVSKTDSYPETHSAPTSPPKPEDAEEISFTSFSAKTVSSSQPQTGLQKVPHYENISDISIACLEGESLQFTNDVNSVPFPHVQPENNKENTSKSLEEKMVGNMVETGDVRLSDPDTVLENSALCKLNSQPSMPTCSLYHKAQRSGDNINISDAKLQIAFSETTPQTSEYLLQGAHIRSDLPSIPRKTSKTPIESGHHPFMERLAALGKLKGTDDLQCNTQSVDKRDIQCSAPKIHGVGEKSKTTERQSDRGTSEHRHTKFTDSLDGKAYTKTTPSSNALKSYESETKSATTISDSSKVDLEHVSSKLHVAKVDGPKIKGSMSTSSPDPPQVLRNYMKCNMAQNPSYSSKTAPSPQSSPTKVPAKSPSKPNQASYNPRGSKPFQDERITQKPSPRAEEKSKQISNKKKSDSLPLASARSTEIIDDRRPLVPNAQSAIEQKVMKGIEENMLKLQEQDRSHMAEVKQKTSNGIASWFGLKKSKLPALNRKPELSKLRLSMPSAGKDAKTAAKKKLEVESLNISKLMEKAEDLRRALEEERAYMNGVAMDRSGKGHSCEVVMDQSQGHLSVMYRGVSSDSFMQQLLTRVDKDTSSFGIAPRRLSFDSKKSRPLFSHQRTSVGHAKVGDELEKGSDVVSKDVTSEESFTESISSQHFTGSGSSMRTLDSGIGTFPLPEYTGSTPGKNAARMKGEQELFTAHSKHGPVTKAPSKARTLERELSSLEEIHPMYGSALEGKTSAMIMSSTIHEDVDIYEDDVQSPPSNWTFSSAKASPGPADVYLGVKGDMEPSFHGTPRRNLKSCGPTGSRETDSQQTCLARRGKGQTANVPEMKGDAGLELIKEQPDDILSPSRPQVLETPESLSDSLYDSLSSCGSQG